MAPIKVAPALEEARFCAAHLRSTRSREFDRRCALAIEQLIRIIEQADTTQYSVPATALKPYA